ncbi:hypothetical protein [Mycolicibacter senuensis]|jgi:hypothetical protein|uniref:hypothetical protein n=1 Tax=Mycolicibacter senuensis TaxID=386913 RepID=UPI00140328BE|nr:hypothetical protein [Mycolicibacter senuensis]
MGLRKGQEAESDAEPDAYRTGSRAGKDEDGTHVGRISPDDALDVGETGAEARSDDA